MSNILRNILNYIESRRHHQENTMLDTDAENSFIPVNEFKFMGPFEEDDSTNGLYFNDIYLPEEVITNILSFVPPRQLLKLTRVCKKWCNIIKSENFWMHIYNEGHSTKGKKLPWYVYYCYFATNNFDQNLLKNGNGQQKYKFWKIMKRNSKFSIEDPPAGSDPLPLDVPDFRGHTSCFATSYMDCNKIQIISLKSKRLFQYILCKFHPHIYVSEWVAARFDCGCIYRLVITGHDEHFDVGSLSRNEYGDYDVADPVFHSTTSKTIAQWEGRQWEKVELLVKEYPPGFTSLVFEHEGRDTQFWAGHYGSKMAGGVVKVLFDSIQPLEGEVGTNSAQSDQNIEIDV